MTISTVTERSIQHVGITQMSDHEWRVCDRRIDSEDGQSIIGFIEMRGGRYEVIKFGDPLQFSAFGSLPRAVEAFAVQGSGQRHLADGNRSLT